MYIYSSGPSSFFWSLDYPMKLSATDWNSLKSELLQICICLRLGLSNFPSGRHFVYSLTLPACYDIVLFDTVGATGNET